MFPTNANDPLRITDDDPGPASARPEVTTDFSPGSSSAERDTRVYVPGEATEPERAAGAVSVPGYAIQAVLGRGGMGFCKPSPFWWLFLPGSLVLPFVAEASYVIVTREWIIISTLWDYLGWADSLAVGLACLWQLPISRQSRAAWTFVYVPVVGFLLVDFLSGFIGMRYGAWL
jgi:hypothetical protein